MALFKKKIPTEPPANATPVASAVVPEPRKDESKALRAAANVPSSQVTVEEQARLAKKRPLAPIKKKRKPLITFGVSRNEKIFFIDNLSTMLNAGLSISLALATLIVETKSKTMKRALVDLEHEIDNGGQLSDGLMKHPEIFPPLYVAVIQVGEASGTLSEVLKQLTAVAKKDKALRSKIVNAMIYPSVIVVAMIGILIVLMIYVFPQLIAIFEEVDAKLPMQTRILIAIVDFMQVYGVYLLLGLFFLIMLLFGGRKVRPIKRMYDWFFLHIPIIGNILKQVVLTRILGNMRMLLLSGVPIVKSFSITSRTAGNRIFEDSLIRIGKELELGKSLHEVLALMPFLYPTLAVTMAKVGEETGKLDEIMGKLEEFYSGRVDNIFSNLSTLIEPILLLVMGVVVGFIAISVIMPIYDLAQAF